MSTALVMGASGFLGSHVVKQLAAAGRSVRIMVRASSDTRAIRHLDIEHTSGDVNDRQAVAAAMQGCDSVFYCVVDTRAWLRDPAPLYRTNVEGLRTVLDVALDTKVKRFVFTSTFGTIGINPAGISTEEDAFNWWDKAPDYVRCRVQAEQLFLEYCQRKGLPGVACCVGNTYGDADVVPTPHGKMVKDAATGKMPYYWDGGGPSVGIRDAARALILAEEKGVVGQRYIVADRWVGFQELFTLAANAAGVEPPKKKIPLAVLYFLAGLADFMAIFSRKENRFSVASIRCSTMLPDVSGEKARAELGWCPQAVESAIVEAVEYYLAHPD